MQRELGLVRSLKTKMCDLSGSFLVPINISGFSYGEKLVIIILGALERRRKEYKTKL